MKSKPIHNPELPFIIDNWQGNPLNKKNEYVNIDGPSEKTFKELFKWQTSKNKFKSEKKNQQSPITVLENKINLYDTSNGIVWLGHASFIFTIANKNLIVDPILYNVGPVKRHTKLPCSTGELKNIHYILLSHNHRDHLDKKSLKLICNQNPEAVILTGLNITSILKKWQIKNKIIEAGWYQNYLLKENFEIYYLPAKHWNRRGLTDLNQMLWGSFIIKNQNKTIYFAADSGYGKHFNQIGKIFPNIDTAILGIGACEPEWFMHTSHTSPAKAIQAFNDLNAKQFIPMHYGTFDLSDEPIFYPEIELKRLVENTANEHKIKFMQIGEKS